MHIANQSPLHRFASSRKQSPRSHRRVILPEPHGNGYKRVAAKLAVEPDTDIPHPKHALQSNSH